MHIQFAIMQNMDWDIFRYVVAVVDSGSAVSAARSLGVNSSTVLRKITKFEEENGIRLFERRQTGYAPTVECAAVVEAARQIEQSVAGISRDILGRDLRLEGRLSVTTTDTLLKAVLAPHIASFKALHPRIQLDISVTNIRLNLTRHDADVAIRASNRPPDALVGQRVSDVALCIYGPKDLAKTLGSNPDLATLKEQDWIGVGDALAGSPVGNWMNEHIPTDRIGVTTDTFVAIRDCVLSGCGIAVLPCCLGDRTADLDRIGPPIPEMQTALWILTHADVRGAARVKAFNDHMTKSLRLEAHYLDGSACP